MGSPQEAALVVERKVIATQKHLVISEGTAYGKGKERAVSCLDASLRVRLGGKALPGHAA